MTSEERHEARYQRRKAKRKLKFEEQFVNSMTISQVFSYSHMYKAYRKSKRNVSWKASVQLYTAHHGRNIALTIKKLFFGVYRSSGFYEFDLNERGHIRHIKAVGIFERVIQSCLCAFCLVPILSRTFIYDNGASLTGKGYHFQLKRLRRRLTKFIQKYGLDAGYILIFDFSGFFDSIDHELCKKILKDLIYDPRVYKLCCQFIDAFDGDVGLGLGSEISQILALSSASPIDHYFKEVLRVKFYGRYMDDGYIIHHDKKFLLECYDALKSLADKYGFKLNLKKTHIVKLSHGFTFLQKRFRFTKKGKIVMKLSKTSVARERRKLKKLKNMVIDGRLTEPDVYQSFQSWRAYASKSDSWKSIQSMTNLYNQLFQNR